AALFGLGEKHSGAFVSGATMSNLVGLAVAREWLGEQLGVSVADEGVGALGPVRVHSGAAHSSVSKALSVLGLGRDSLRPVPTLPDREAIDVDRLADELDGTPAIVVANAGTVDTVDFDDLRALVDLRSRKKFWLHVDAAFGGFAALSPRHAHLVDGLAEADSVCVDLHKWLNVPYESGFAFVRDPSLLGHAFGTWNAPYLPEPDEERVNYNNLGPESSRRARALPIWATLRAYGREGHRAMVERHRSLALRLGRRIAESPDLELLAPVTL
ncbi:aspartate aminotransferase family protein, partial [Saccharothrix sp. MB29]|nr:aspartate aminotransferase family protein [Saccharothrix sp. MB29]